MTCKKISGEIVLEFGSIFSAINYMQTVIKVNLLQEGTKAKQNAFKKLFHKGVVLKQINSGILWEITELRNWPQDVRPKDMPPSNIDPQPFVIAKSLTSGYKKSIWPSQFDRFTLHDAPKTVKVLFGNGDVQNR